MSIGDELAKFAALRDSGHITQEEFEAQKARLLTAPFTQRPSAPVWTGPDPAQRKGRGLGLLLIVLLVITGLAVTANASRTSPPSTPTSYIDKWGGSPAVYAEIAASSDCDELQETFDRAGANNDGAQPGTAEHKWTIGYMEASLARMKAIGC